MGEKLLHDARLRYSVAECDPGVPASEHYAAARRWLACARDAFKWAARGSEASSPSWMVRACEALVRAELHRGWARQWRSSAPNAPGRLLMEGAMHDCLGCNAKTDAEGDLCAACEGDDETRAIFGRAEAKDSARRSIRAYYAAARQTLRMARVYRAEPGTTGRRERECLDEVRKYRRAIRDVRADARRRERTALPGVRKAPLDAPAHERKRVG